MIQKGTFHAMGSHITLVVDCETPDEFARAETDMRAWFEEWENIFSRFRPNSELSRLNHSEGKPFQASSEMMEVLHLAQEEKERTAGLVTPVILDALEYSGYARDFDELAKTQILSDLASIPPLPDTLNFELNDRDSVVLLPQGVHLDLGGYAKGWSAHQAMIRLREFFPVLINAGGDIACSGLQRNGTKWLIGIENPLEPKTDTALVEIGEGGLATSGKDYRRWMKNGSLQHHLIDPRTGMPAVTDVMSATVIAGTVMDAEAASKAALIAGSQSALPWLDAQPETGYFLQLDDGRIITNTIFEQFRWSFHEFSIL